MHLPTFLPAATAAFFFSFAIAAPAAEPQSNEVNVMTFNMWNGGEEVNNYNDKQVNFIKESGADIIGLQEATRGHAIRLGKALGWSYWQSDENGTIGGSVGIISKFPITKNYGEVGRAGGVQIFLNDPKRFKSAINTMNIWSTHLGSDPYGPYQLCFHNSSKEDVIKGEEKSGRVPQIKALLDKVKSQADGNSDTPFVLVGDFNAPSHLDWTVANKEAHCNTTFEWPISKLVTDAGLIDSFREVHPNSFEQPGNTWSPVNPRHDGNTGDLEPQDRLDFVYYGSKKLTASGSKTLVVGVPKPRPDVKDNEWTSDHRAVMTTFKISEK